LAATACVNGYHDATDSAAIPYCLLNVTPRVTSVLAKNAPRLVAFADKSRPAGSSNWNRRHRHVTIFEASSGGLFIPAEAGVRPGNFNHDPSSARGRARQYYHTYAGSIRAEAHQVEIQQAIVDSLSNAPSSHR